MLKEEYDNRELLFKNYLSTDMQDVFVPVINK